jgi:hypothetical protein
MKDKALFNKNHYIQMGPKSKGVPGDIVRET